MKPAHQSDTPRAVSDRDVSVEAAAILLTLAMRETERPVAELGDAILRMNTALVARSDEHTPHLREDLAVCIQSLQFHDRLIQQIAAVRNLLTALADHAPLDVSGFGAQRWENLLQTLRERLTADSHHQVFDLLLRTGAIELEGRTNPEKLEGSVELF
jgi:hypothetical protein